MEPAKAPKLGTGVSQLKEMSRQLAQGIQSLRNPGDDPANWPEDLDKDLETIADEAESLAGQAAELMLGAVQGLDERAEEEGEGDAA